MSSQAHNQFEDKGYFRRQFPRRAMKRKAGVLCDGTYFIVDTGEVGEGGISILSEYVLSEGRELVISFQVPAGEFVTLRATVRSTQKKEGDHRVTHGLSFNEVAFAIKRQIRAFVSARKDESKLN